MPDAAPVRGVRARARWRAAGRSWLLWSVVLGVAAGIPLAAASGARRTETAYERFLDDTEAFDLLVVNGGTTPDNVNRQFDFDDLASRPEVAETARLNYYLPEGLRPDGLPLTSTDLLPVAPVDGAFGTEMNEVRILSGRLPEGQDEIALTPLASDEAGAEVGDVLRMDLGGTDAASQPAHVVTDPDGRFEVVGLIASNAGFPPASGGVPPIALLSPAYAEEHPDAAQILTVRLVAGTAGISDFVNDLVRIGAPDQVVTANRSELSSLVQRGLDVQATALRAFATVVATVVVLLAFQVLRARLAADAAEDEVWRALGLTRRQLDRSRAGLGLAVAPVAAAIALLTALALSPLFVVGVAEDVDPGGMPVDAAALVAGVLVTLGVALLLHLGAAWWYAVIDRVHRLRARRPRFVPVVAAIGAPPTLVTGVRLAVEGGRGGRPVPTRSAVVGVGVGVAAVTGVLVFAASLNHLFDEPALYGWPWDAQVGGPFTPDLSDLADDLRQEQGVEAVALATSDSLTVDDLDVDVLAMDPDQGLAPTVAEGRAPADAGEAMLGVRTARQLGVGVGDPVTAALGDRTADLEVVGIGVLPGFSGIAGLGEGMSLSLDGLRRLDPATITNVVLVDVTPDAIGEAIVDDLQRDWPGDLVLPSKPTDLGALERVGGLPSVVALVLAVGGLLSLAVVLVSSVRRRRWELATFKAIGFVRRQVAVAITWQATTLVVLGLVVGLPLGIAAGRLLWLFLADRVGAPDVPVVPVGQLAALVVVTLVAGALTGAVPALLATRTRASTALRAE
jgi:putative ABC transport system permease protein